MIKYQENGNGIIRKVEIDTTRVTDQGKQVLEEEIQRLKDNIDEEYQGIYIVDKDNNKFVYQTEVLAPKRTKERLSPASPHHQ